MITKLIYKTIHLFNSLVQKVNERYYIKKYNFPKSVQIKHGKVNFNGQIVCAEGCKFIGDLRISANSEVKIGRYTVINGPNTDIYCSLNPISIGAFCSIARNVSIQEFNHDYTRFTTSFIEKNLLNKRNRSMVSAGPIVIGNDVWIGSQCVILSGTKIGDGVVVAANSVVKGDIPPYAIVAGSPAKILKYRFPPEIRIKIMESKWWEKINKDNFDDYAKMFNNNSNLQ